MAGQRTNLTLRYQLAHTGANQNDSHYIDLARDLSMVNRRFYRQGLYYYVSKITVHNQTDSWVKFCTANDSWVTKNAWIKAFKLWMEHNKKPASNTQHGAYSDFKIYLNSYHEDNADRPNPIMSADSGAEIEIGPPNEWRHSRFYSDDGDDFKCHLIGPTAVSLGNVSSLGLIDDYRIGRYTVPEFSPPNDGDGDPSESVLNNLFNASGQHDNLIQELETANDETPYEIEMLLGDASRGQTMLQAQCATSPSSGQVASVGGFCVPFGLLEIVTKSISADDTIGITVEMSPGPYKGVFAERIV